MQIWDDSDASNCAQVEVDQFERSACAVPVTRGPFIGGVLIVSSAQSGFFREPAVCQVVEEYALMMGVALADQDDYSSDSYACGPCLICDGSTRS